MADIFELLKRASVEEPFARKINAEVVKVGEGEAVVRMRAASDMTNIFGMIHGGAIFSLMDEAFQLACNSHGTVSRALNVNITYLAPPKVGGLLTAEAKEISCSNRIGVYQIRVTDESGKLIATAQAVAYRKKDPLPFSA
ncbi:TPA: PaaI family thioesterase [Candidatus Poribacteria bacterium]|nr:PaaI family thioesterase [Candidatus Poribacteria bacterium]HEX29723.1 PaaI family thioesterase [Candidatus Poribacteria bacterium]